jgi:hypothetical protein
MCWWKRCVGWDWRGRSGSGAGDDDSIEGAENWGADSGDCAKGLDCAGRGLPVRETVGEHLRAAAADSGAGLKLETP